MGPCAALQKSILQVGQRCHVANCKVLTLHGLLTRHVAHARARYRCRTAVHTASTLEVQYRPHSELEFRLHSETNITTGFGSKSKTAPFNTYYYSVGSLFEVCASPVTSRTLCGTLLPYY